MAENKYMNTEFSSILCNNFDGFFFKKSILKHWPMKVESLFYQFSMFDTMVMNAKLFRIHL